MVSIARSMRYLRLAPLTLLTSWFGMNFTNMPGLDWRWGYEAIIAVSVIIVVIEIIIFKRKKWL